MSYAPPQEPFDKERCPATFHATGQRCRRRIHEPEPVTEEKRRIQYRWRHVTDPAELVPESGDPIYQQWDEYVDDED